ncbi:sec-independent protein translocase protein TatA [Alkalibacillus salilacus]|uniref:Sec-independent protein translocase protein TatA n=2 Tax=Alkalibacillus salilacus TaxID=284582 RepID=A0ABT9VI93_9BACI|nr:sec-independent protein translocase protein TatA [Alkalibacillus salilacus]
MGQVGVCMTVGVPGLILILIILLIIFGPKKLPELGQSLGQSLREFKNSTRGITDEDDSDSNKTTDRQ